MNNKIVLFIGTPCQAHGLSNFLIKKFDNLIIVDLLCYGIQSTKAWRKYRDEIINKYGKIESINMRDKSISWQNYSMKINFKNGNSIVETKNENPYLRSYSKGIFIRPSCYTCSLKAFPRASDITIGDFWDIDKIIPNKNDGKGAGLVLINSDKGNKLVEVLSDKFYVEDIDKEKLEMVHPLFCINAKKNNASNIFYKYVDTDIKFSKLIRKCENHPKNLIKKYIKKLKGDKNAVIKKIKKF